MHTALVDVGLFIAMGLVAIALVGWFGYIAKRKRARAFALMATQLGLEYFPDDPFGTLSEPFAFFEKGDGRGVEDVAEIEGGSFQFWDSTNDKLQDAQAAYGAGIDVTLLGLPVKIDFAKQTDLKTSLSGFKTSWYIGYTF